MQDMRYLNLFAKITGVSTRFCFKYNDFIVFSVPRKFVSKAIGGQGKNVRKLNEILGRKIKIVSSPENPGNIEEFLRSVVSPVGFSDIEVVGKDIIINAGNQNKAALIGRNKRRLLELQKIAKDFLGKELRIN